MTMPRYIDKDKLVNKLKEDCETLVKERWLDDYVQGYSSAIDDIIAEPTADVQEVKHGYWIDWAKIESAVDVVKMGTSNRCDIDGVIVYKCGTVIRIDIKNQFE